jgi:hypothetical protein
MLKIAKGYPEGENEKGGHVIQPKNSTTNSHRPQYLELIHVYLFGNLRISININIYIKLKI